MCLRLSTAVPSGLTSKFTDLERNLAKASLHMTFQTYVGLMVFATVLSGGITFALAIPLTGSIVVALLGGLLVALCTFGTCYTYPMLSISSKARKIEANLPLTANFMAVLASSGMPPERIFRSLANVGDEFAVGEEVRRIIGDIEVLGLDLNEALKNGSVRSASNKFGGMLDGIVTTAHVGGDLAAYLREEAEKFKKARVASMKSYLDSLAGMAEVYVSFLIALPIALVVMLSIMSFLGGGAMMMGNLDPQMMLLLLAFVITPAGAAVLLLIVDSLTPPR
ncbi:MAG: type II secretion system F family protein [Candidatus Bathyarchaeia archaeon]|jgi:flagellar protein FlaJ